MDACLRRGSGSRCFGIDGRGRRERVGGVWETNGEECCVRAGLAEASPRDCIQEPSG